LKLLRVGFSSSKLGKQSKSILEKRARPAQRKQQKSIDQEGLAVLPHGRTMRSRTLFVVIFATIVVVEPCSAQSLEEAWLFKDNSVIVKCTKTNGLRGFNEHWLEERTLDTAMQNKVTRYPLLSAKEFAHYQRSGEFELFQTALRTALTQHKLQFERTGWESPLGQADPALPQFASRVVKQNIQIRAQRATSESSILLWQQPQSYQDLGFERKADRSLLKVLLASTSPHSNTVALQLSTAPSIHAQVLLQTRVLLFDRAELLKLLPPKAPQEAVGEI
jgi:hypothetical protein